MFYFLSSHTPTEQPFVGPPQMGPKLLATYRKAFTEMYRSPEFIADAHKSRMELDPHSGERKFRKSSPEHWQHRRTSSTASRRR